MRRSTSKLLAVWISPKIIELELSSINWDRLVIDLGLRWIQVSVLMLDIGLILLDTCFANNSNAMLTLISHLAEVSINAILYLSALIKK